MPFLTTVVESNPERRSGFLKNPEGGENIYFDFEGWRKKVDGSLVCANAKKKTFPPEGSKVEVVDWCSPSGCYPKAKAWRLVERGKTKS